MRNRIIVFFVTLTFILSGITAFADNELPPMELHNSTYVPYKAASCTEGGNIGYWYCDECGGYFADEDGIEVLSWNEIVIPAKGHKWDSGVTSNGITVYTCTVCKQTKSSPAASTKKTNPLTLKISSKAYKRSKLKKAKTFKIGAAGKGKITYARDAKAKKAKIKVNSKGKVTIPKKCKKGLYNITVKAAGNKSYDPATKNIEIRVY